VFEQDYIMRLIKEMVRALVKLLFGIDTQTPTAELLQDAEQKQTMEELYDLVDAGKICEAENRVIEWAENGKRSDLETAVLFYSYLNEKSDAFLEEHQFSREEIMEGLKGIASRHGLEGMANLFLQ
jgi:NH3-dependent NAD+ synthetase